MKLTNPDGQAVYYNQVIKHGVERYVIQAADRDTVVTGRDGQKKKSRTFAQEHQAEAYLKRNGYQPI